MEARSTAGRATRPAEARRPPAAAAAPPRERTRGRSRSGSRSRSRWRGAAPDLLLELRLIAPAEITGEARRLLEAAVGRDAPGLTYAFVRGDGTIASFAGGVADAASGARVDP